MKTIIVKVLQDIPAVPHTRFPRLLRCCSLGDVAVHVWLFDKFCDLDCIEVGQQLKVFYKSRTFEKGVFSIIPEAIGLP